MATIRNAAALEEVFGFWPSFHDAEVVELRLGRGQARDDQPERRKPWLEAKIHVWETTSDVTSERFYGQRHHTSVTFAFYGIDELRMNGFTHQNVLWELALKDISDRQLEVLRWEVSFPSSYGLEAFFLCEDIEILRVSPYASGPGDGPGRQLPAQPPPKP